MGRSSAAPRGNTSDPATTTRVPSLPLTALPHRPDADQAECVNQVGLAGVLPVTGGIRHIALGASSGRGYRAGADLVTCGRSVEPAGHAAGQRG
jgi:hypothetical protein